MLMKRWLSAATAAILMSGAVLADAQAQDKRFEGVTLVVGTFGGSWKDRINEYIGREFTALGGTLSFVEGNPRDLLAKLVAARGQAAPMDVVEVVDTTWPLIDKAGFAATLNLDNIPNVKHLDESMYDDGKVANWITEEGFILLGEKFKELDIAVPTKFTDLVNPKLAGRITFPDINVNTAINPIVGFAINTGGDVDNLASGLEAIRDLQVHSFWNSGTQVTQLFQTGDIWAAIAHAGWGVRLFDAGVPVCMVHPVVGSNRGMISRGYAAVVANSEQAEAAEWYINMLVSEEMQTILHTQNGVVPTNTLVQSKYAADPKLDACGNPFLLLSPEEIGNLYSIDYDKLDMEGLIDQWNRTVAQ